MNFAKSHGSAGFISSRHDRLLSSAMMKAEPRSLRREGIIPESYSGNSGVINFFSRALSLDCGTESDDPQSGEAESRAVRKRRSAGMCSS